MSCLIAANKTPYGEIVTRRLNARRGSICTEKLPIQSRVAGSIELDTYIHANMMHVLRKTQAFSHLVPMVA